MSTAQRTVIKLSFNRATLAVLLRVLKIYDDLVFCGPDAIIVAPAFKHIQVFGNALFLYNVRVKKRFSVLDYFDTKRLTVEVVDTSPECPDIIGDNSAESEDSHTGEMMRFKRNVIAKKHMQVNKSAQVQGSLQACKQLNVDGVGTIRGNATICGDVIIKGRLVCSN